MIIGCPKEIKNHEYRVGLTPESAHELVAHGHEVLIETGFNISETARRLGMHRRTLARKLAKRRVK